ncbi:MAG: hypothetical protein EAX96_21150, partial [Candidatus Lokiarchaeota archaeon]|nr:hypothetical protein [Candidatus Lokiarchaeota archaeon]
KIYLGQDEERSLVNFRDFYGNWTQLYGGIVNASLIDNYIKIKADGNGLATTFENGESFDTVIYNSLLFEMKVYNATRVVVIYNPDLHEKDYYIDFSENMARLWYSVEIPIFLFNQYQNITNDILMEIGFWIKNSTMEISNIRVAQHFNKTWVQEAEITLNMTQSEATNSLDSQFYSNETILEFESTKYSYNYSDFIENGYNNSQASWEHVMINDNNTITIPNYTYSSLQAGETEITLNNSDSSCLFDQTYVNTTLIELESNKHAFNYSLNITEGYNTSQASWENVSIINNESIMLANYLNLEQLDYDHFDDNYINSTIWNAVSGSYESGTTITIPTGAGAAWKGVARKTLSLGDFRVAGHDTNITIKIKNNVASAGSGWACVLGVGSGIGQSNYMIGYLFSGSTWQVRNNISTWENVAGTYGADTYYILSIIIHDNDSISYWKDEIAISIYDMSGDSNLDDYLFWFGGSNGINTVDVYDVHVSTSMSYHNAYYISNIVDFNSTYKITNMTINTYVPTNTTCEVYVSDNKTGSFNAWVNYSIYIDNITRFLKYKILLNTSTTSNQPIFYNISFYYSNYICNLSEFLYFDYYSESYDCIFNSSNVISIKSNISCDIANISIYDVNNSQFTLNQSINDDYANKSFNHDNNSVYFSNNTQLFYILANHSEPFIIYINLIYLKTTYNRTLYFTELNYSFQPTIDWGTNTYNFDLMNNNSLNISYCVFETGIHDALYNFRDDEIGEIPNGWVGSGNVEGIEVIAENDSHKQVVRMDSGDGGSGYLQNSFNEKSSGSIELHVKLGQIDKSLYIWLSGSPTQLVLTFRMDGKIVWESSQEVLASYSADIWYHVKIYFDCDTDLASVWLDSELIGEDLSFYLLGESFTMLKFQYFLQNTIILLDAIDYSWAEGYYPGRNTHLLTYNDFTFENISSYQNINEEYHFSLPFVINFQARSFTNNSFYLKNFWDKRNENLNAWYVSDTIAFDGEPSYITEITANFTEYGENLDIYVGNESSWMLMSSYEGWTSEIKFKILLNNSNSINVPFFEDLTFFYSKYIHDLSQTMNFTYYTELYASIWNSSNIISIKTNVSLGNFNISIYDFNNSEFYNRSFSNLNYQTQSFTWSNNSIYCPISNTNTFGIFGNSSNAFKISINMIELTTIYNKSLYVGNYNFTLLEDFEKLFYHVKNNDNLNAELHLIDADTIFSTIEIENGTSYQAGSMIVNSSELYLQIIYQSFSNTSIYIREIFEIKSETYRLINESNRQTPSNLIFTQEEMTIAIVDYFGNVLYRKGYNYTAFIDIALPVTTVTFHNFYNHSIIVEIVRGLGTSIEILVAPESSVSVRVYATSYLVHARNLELQTLLLTTFSPDGSSNVVFEFGERQSVDFPDQDFWSLLWEFFFGTWYGILLFVLMCVGVSISIAHTTHDVYRGYQARRDRKKDKRRRKKEKEKKNKEGRRVIF